MSNEKWWEDAKWLRSDYFLIMVAQTVMAYPKINQKFEQLYQTDKYHYYHLARKSTAYSHPLISKGKLSLEVTTKRNLGILLVANENENFCLELVRYFCDNIPSLEAYIKKPADNNNFVSSIIKTFSPQKALISKENATLYVSAYAIAHMWKERALSSPLCLLVKTVIEKLENAETTIDKPRIYTNPELFEIFKFSQEDWNFIREFKDSSIVSTIRANWNVPGMFPSILDELEDTAEKDKVSATVNAMWSQLLRHDLHWDDLFPTDVLSREDKRNILSSCQAMSDIEGGFRSHHFVMVYFVYMLSKELHDMREFYWNNNAETQFFETERLMKENSDLKAELKTIQNEYHRLQNETRAAAKSARKETYEAEKTYREIICSLEKQVAALTKQLQSTQRKYEELAFLKEQESQTEKCEIKLTDILNGRKILIIGGHTVWRKNLRQAVSSITVVDGVTTALDLKQLDHIDMLVFYTFNMAHTAYERIIAYARQKKIAVAYLPRITNVELIEQELVKLLQNFDDKQQL